MTPTEEKAKAKAEELIDSTFFDPYSEDETQQKRFALSHCDEMIETLSSIKGMGKISKLNFWKKVKEYVLLQE